MNVFLFFPLRYGHDFFDNSRSHPTLWNVMLTCTKSITRHDEGAPPASADVDHSDSEWIARNYPFRGHKGLIWDGGTRVAGFISSPLLPASVRGTEWHGQYFHCAIDLACRAVSCNH